MQVKLLICKSLINLSIQATQNKVYITDMRSLLVGFTPLNEDRNRRLQKKFNNSIFHPGTCSVWSASLKDSIQNMMNVWLLHGKTSAVSVTAGCVSHMLDRQQNGFRCISVLQPTGQHCSYRHYLAEGFTESSYYSVEMVVCHSLLSHNWIPV